VAPEPRIRVGVAGWDYPDWAGIVYPSRSRSFDRLGFLSRFVDVVEINSTFYRPANPRSAEAWAVRAEKRPGFTFTAKAHRDLTHDAETDVASASHETKLGLTPLRGAGVLGAVLLQFPQSFHDTPESRERLERLAEAFEGWPTVVEVRHVSWDEDEAAEWMRERGVGWCVVDQPRMGRSTAPMRPRVTSGIGYLRLHGRNAKDWFRKDAGRDARYDYLYRLDQLKPVADVAVELAKVAPVVYAVQNNHFRGQAVVNALQLKHLIEGQQPEAPASLVAEYPELGPLVVETPPRLL
jgi:uncharacterized protein YecE (DUF72 family)